MIEHIKTDKDLVHFVNIILDKITEGKNESYVIENITSTVEDDNIKMDVDWYEIIKGINGEIQEKI